MTNEQIKNELQTLNNLVKQNNKVVKKINIKFCTLIDLEYFIWFTDLKQKRDTLKKQLKTIKN
jgi:hypothetical protein